jgi:hypothetical protein
LKAVEALSLCGPLLKADLDGRQAAIQFFQADNALLVGIQETALLALGSLLLPSDGGALLGQDGRVGRGCGTTCDSRAEDVGVTEGAADIGPDQLVQFRRPDIRRGTRREGVRQIAAAIVLVDPTV